MTEVNCEGCQADKVSELRHSEKQIKVGFGNTLALAEASIIGGLDHQQGHQRLRPRTLRQTLCRRPDCSKDQGGINLDIIPCLTSSPYNDDDQVTLLLSEQDVNLVGDYWEGKENGVTKLLRVIIPIAF